MIDTPRTDAQINGEPCTRFVVLAGDSLRNALVPSEFARQLERENTALRAELDSWRYGNLYREEDLNELIQLRADKERLDSGRIRLEFQVAEDVWKVVDHYDLDLRAAIDAARKEVKP